MASLPEAPFPALARRDAPLGALDSGVGGLTVVREIMALLPHEDVLYLADSANCPYGPRSDEEVRDLARRCADFLLDQGAKIIVVACNTASTAGLSHLRARYGPNVPIVGLVPAVKPAVAATKTRRIGVLATRGTLRGSLLSDVVAQYSTPAGVEVITAVPDGLVEAVEAGDLHGEIPRRILQDALAPLISRAVDVLVLGCTHYPLLTPLIRELVGPGVQIIDSGAGVARRTQQLLAAHGWRSERAAPGTLSVYTSGDPQEVAPVVSRLLGTSTPVLHADLAVTHYSSCSTQQLTP